MNMHKLRRATVLLFLSPMSLVAQMQNDVAPLKPWPAPLYWQPTQLESEIASGKLSVFRNSVPATIPANALVFVGMTPCRIVDTRTGSGFVGAFGPPGLVGGVSRSFPIQSNTTCPIPSIAQAYSFNVTVIPPGFLDFITVWPAGQPRPNASTLNAYVATVISNAAIVAAGAGGSVDVFASQNTNLIIDINGYYAPLSGITLTQGSAGAPSLSFSGDPGTGIFSSGAGNLDFATGGSTRLTVRGDGDLDLPGSIRKGGILFLHELGFGGNTGLGVHALEAVVGTPALDNTATGWGALLSNTAGNYNTASGYSALIANTTGSSNTAIGTAALQSNVAGSGNTATGYQALRFNTASNNTANGSQALRSNTSGSENTASGFGALLSNSDGSFNTAMGSDALRSNTTGVSNAAVGQHALYFNTKGNYNAAFGTAALFANTEGGDNTATGTIALLNNTVGYYNTAGGTGALSANTDGHENTASGRHALYSNNGNYNTASGADALFSNATGSFNTAVGYQALYNNVSGNSNIAIGLSAGVAITGSRNIMIGNVGRSEDVDTTRIGTIQQRAFVEGIRGATTGVPNAVNVVIDSNGQLGTINSSRRFKEDIQDMGAGSSRVLRLRPVTFRYKKPYEDGSKPLDYGLIAEEVAEVFPELVARGADGQVETVQYQKLTPILLNEVQKQQQQMDRQAETIQLLQKQVAALETLLSTKAESSNEDQLKANKLLARTVMTDLRREVAVDIDKHASSAWQRRSLSRRFRQSRSAHSLLLAHRTHSRLRPWAVRVQSARLSGNPEILMAQHFEENDVKQKQEAAAGLRRGGFHGVIRGQIIRDPI